MNLVRNPEQTARFEGMHADTEILRALGTDHAVSVDNDRRVLTVYDYEPAIDYQPTDKKSGARCE